MLLIFQSYKAIYSSKIMTHINCQQVIDSYIKWIKDNTFTKSINNGKFCEITTPFLDVHNDHIQIYVSKENDIFTLTDDGYTISDLEMCGLTIVNSPKRESILKTTLSGFGVKIRNQKEIYIEANINDIGLKKHRLIQALLAVNDMFFLSKENVSSLFKEDVELYFKANDIFYNRDLRSGGKTGFDHNIDFAIPASRTKPARLIKVINKISKEQILLSTFSFSDMLAIREEKFIPIVIFNDAEQEISNENLTAFRNYNVIPYGWSHREEFNQELRLN